MKVKTMNRSPCDIWLPRRLLILPFDTLSSSVFNFTGALFKRSHKSVITAAYVLPLTFSTLRRHTNLISAAPLNPWIMA